MAKFGLKNIFVQIIVGANITTVICMLLTGYSYLVNPHSFRPAATMGLFFPLFLLLNILFLVFWLFFYPRKAYIPFLAMILCYFPVRTYIGINAGGSIPVGAMKVMSYNVLGFHGQKNNVLDRDSNAIAQYLYNEDCDIVCLQESNIQFLSDRCRDMLNKRYPYHHEEMYNGNGNAIYTKYEILSFERIEYESNSNFSMAYRLKINDAEVLVINNHLEKSNITPDERSSFGNMVKGEIPKDSVGEKSLMLLGKLTDSTLRRTRQAQAVAKYIKQHNTMKIILMGDFNDNPISYTHYIIGKDLIDCFRDSGRGLGWSYCHNAMRVRIDNIMCSDHYTPYNCTVDGKVPFSDHYPIKCWLQTDSLQVD